MKNDEDIIAGIRQAFKDIEEEYDRLADECNPTLYDRLADECDPTLKLAVTKWVMKHIVEHAREGGTYRYLIYDRLGFDSDAYGTLLTDGMVISNEFDLDLKERVIDCLKDGDIEGAKRALGYCDVPKCYSKANCGWPDEDDKYRYTCSQHYKQEKSNA